MAGYENIKVAPFLPGFSTYTYTLYVKYVKFSLFRLKIVKDNLEYWSNYNEINFTLTLLKLISVENILIYFLCLVSYTAQLCAVISTIYYYKTSQFIGSSSEINTVLLRSRPREIQTSFSKGNSNIIYLGETHIRVLILLVILFNLDLDIY